MPGRYARGARFQILGPIVAADESGQLKLDGPWVEALLAYLLLHANEHVSTAELLDTLWGREQPQSPATPESHDRRELPERRRESHDRHDHPDHAKHDRCRGRWVGDGCHHRNDDVDLHR